MNNLIINLKRIYRQGPMHVRIIYFNVGAFLIVFLLHTLFRLFNLSSAGVTGFFELPAWVVSFLHQPWSLITYMFLHANVLHLLFNMLWLYCFGYIFLEYYSSRSFLGLYILGGLCGGVLYMLFYNLFPFFGEVVYSSRLVGASASALAITVATAVRDPNRRIAVIAAGGVSLKAIALIMIAIDLLLITSVNAGGHIAHLGGALGGLWFERAQGKGRDITNGINAVIDKLVDLYRKYAPRRHRAKMKVSINPDFQDYGLSKARRRKHLAQIEDVLEKLRTSGYESLTTEEKKSLFDAGDKS